MIRKFLLQPAAAFVLCAFPAAALAQEATGQDEAVDPATDESAAAGEEEIDQTFVFKSEEEEELEALSDEIMSEFSILSEMFAVEPLTPDQESRLPQTKLMAGKMIPEDTFGPVLRESMQPFFDLIQEAGAGEPRNRLSEVSGVEIDDLYELEDEVAEEALDIFDPTYGERT